MPAYSFLCQKCQKVFEIIRPMKDTGPELCPDCQEPSDRYFDSAPRISFHGQGFTRRVG